jgi:hypothetical protein
MHTVGAAEPSLKEFHYAYLLCGITGMMARSCRLAYSGTVNRITTARI